MSDLTVTEFLQEKFRATGEVTVTDWMSKHKVDLSLQSCTAVLLRGQTKGLQVMLTLAACLGCTTEELKWVSKECGDRTLWRYINQGELSQEEMEFLKQYRALNSEQRSIIEATMRNMGPTRRSHK